MEEKIEISMTRTEAQELSCALDILLENWADRDSGVYKRTCKFLDMLDACICW